MSKIHTIHKSKTYKWLHGYMLHLNVVSTCIKYVAYKIELTLGHLCTSKPMLETYIFSQC
jgi:hypothetical protein